MIKKFSPKHYIVLILIFTHGPTSNPIPTTVFQNYIIRNSIMGNNEANENIIIPLIVIILILMFIIFVILFTCGRIQSCIAGDITEGTLFTFPSREKEYEGWKCRVYV